MFISVGQIPVVQLNFAALSNETPFDRDTVESCVKEVLQALSRSVQAKRNVEFHFAGIGRLSIRESKVKMKFYKEFLRSMDGSGSLVHALSNVSILVVVQFYPWFNFYFPLFCCMVMYDKRIKLNHDILNVRFSALAWSIPTAVFFGEGKL